MRLIAAALVLLSLSSCEVIEQPSGLIPRWTTAYKQVISETDRVRLRDIVINLLWWNALLQ